MELTEVIGTLKATTIGSLWPEPNGPAIGRLPDEGGIRPQKSQHDWLRNSMRVRGQFLLVTLGRLEETHQ